MGKNHERYISFYELLDKKAVTIPPGSEKLICVGLLGGRGYPSDPDVRGMWLGHTWTHRKEHFYRSLLEGFAYEYCHALKVMREIFPQLKLGAVRVIGGGSRSNLWNQIKCDVMGIQYERLGRDDFALLGAALLAGRAVGIYDDIISASKSMAHKRKTFFPDEKNHAFYQSSVDVYEGIFDCVRGLFVDLQQLPDYR
jgi:xylulokinase